MRILSARLKTEDPSPSSPSLPPAERLSRGLNVDMSSVGFQSSSNYDPDTPIPSVESEDTPILLIDSEPSLGTGDGGFLSMETVYRPGIFTPQPSGEDNVQDVISLHESRLHTADSTEEVPPQTKATSSIHILPSATLLRPPSEDDTLLRSMETFNIQDQELNSQDPQRSCGTPSPSPSRRRRSGSAIIREIHRVEDEEPPKADMPEVQKAFSTALSCVSNTASVLSSSNLHLEPDSTTHKLYREALALAQFQLPSSRILGLIGDSGAGKSSLINSLLDKPDLARAVCTVDRFEDLFKLISTVIECQRQCLHMCHH